MNNKDRANKLRNEYGEWAKNNFSQKAGFFPIFYHLKNHLPNLSGGAVSLFIYLGMHCNNSTGECYHEISTIAKYFKKTQRTVSAWFNELEKYGLIERFQINFNGVSHTFIKPYDWDHIE